MKRDMDLIRLLMLKLEALPMRPGGAYIISHDNDEVQIPEYSGDEIAYHLRLIQQAGFVTSSNFKPMSGGITFSGFSWEGHDFLDSVRDPEIWQKTEGALKQAGGFSLDLAKALAKGFIKKKIEQHTGVELDL
ncbi:hypothetical protein NXC12_PD00037 (plasmid) [Rhizobium etli]|uniref:DUF2513 domain-containing protein n=1 Tax=Rhizobium etli TaxID=29449 RepID=A0AAN1BL21_RHIET|nr:DUF2513 domain-containing protein [Rhizobium etli]ARQ13149.1 hypothetical protein NXC12_PD00037 [Rhizobium etli]